MRAENAVATSRLGLSRNLDSRQPDKLCIQLVVRFRIEFVKWNAINRTDLATLWRIKMSHAFSTFARINFIDFDALVDRAVGALRLAHITVDALIGDFETHVYLPTLDISAFIVSGCTNSPTSPPMMAISRTMVAEMNMYLSDGVKNMVSTPGLSLRFMPAI